MAGETTPLFSMAVTEELTGLTRRQIRYYERHGLLTPHRTGGGHRLFSQRDVAHLRRIKQLLGRGFRTIESLRGAIGAAAKRDFGEVLPSGGRATHLRPQEPVTERVGDAAIRLMAPIRSRGPEQLSWRLPERKR